MAFRFARKKGRNERIHSIRALIITHLHLDHFKDAVGFLENCKSTLRVECERLIFNWPSNRQQLAPDADGHSETYRNPKRRNQARLTAYQELVAWAERNTCSCFPLLRTNNNNGDRLEIDGEIKNAIRILQPFHGHMGVLIHLGLNNTSAILRIEGPGSSALLTADIEPAGWSHLTHYHSDLRSDVLKFPHHGAWKNADPADILTAVDPSIVIISVGTDGIQYNHPNVHVFDAIRNRLNTKLLCTQATSRCVDNPGSHTSVIHAILQAHSHGSRHIRTSRGCPCAGTIIVELGNQVTVLKPDIAVHINQIIRPFLTSHQCRI